MNQKNTNELNMDKEIYRIKKRIETLNKEVRNKKVQNNMSFIELVQKKHHFEQQLAHILEQQIISSKH